MRNTLRAASCDLSLRLARLAGRRPAALAQARNVFAKKQLVFCVTNGRSGSKTLATLFDCLEQVQAGHEPAPSFHLVMRWAQHNAVLAESFWLFKKLPAIAASNKPIYLETSHLFAKGFLEPLVELGGRPKLIFLSRDPRAAAISMLRLNDIPGRTRRALKWYLAPADALCAGLPPEKAAAMSDYQLCYWHVLETEARQQHYAQLAGGLGLTTASADISELNSIDGFEALCEALGISIGTGDRQRLCQIVGIKENRRDAEKSISPLTVQDPGAEEAQVRSFIVPCPAGPKRSAGLGGYLSTARRGL
jgi:hypothetical protein